MSGIGKKYRKMKEKIRIHPQKGKENDEFELDSVEEAKANNKKRSVLDKSSHAINFIANIKNSVNKWKRYRSDRRKPRGDGVRLDRKNTGGLGLEGDVTIEDVTDGHPMSYTERQMVIDHNRNLIQYFAKLGDPRAKDEIVNLEYVESLLKGGARIDCTDKHGQTVFHEVARAWHPDVAKFLIEHGADVNLGDNFGRTPLHVASAVDYADMVSFLIENGANKECRTRPEKQTPVHFAARNDACASLATLIKEGCEYKEVRDYKGRTPLHLAAELDRSETARFLLELNDPAPAGVCDNSNQAAIVWMITKMPPVAKLALDQFHTTDRANRRQYYHLHKLEPKPVEEDPKSFPQSALQVIVNHKQHELILHESIRRLIRTKWKKFGLKGAIFSTFINLLFIILWSVQGIAIEYDKRHEYIMPQHWWRILLFVLAVGLTIYQLQEELNEFFHSRKAYSQWREWREKELQLDIDKAHPRWPEERDYLEQEMEELDNIRPQYFNDFWNIYDWMCYAFLLVVIITHLVDVFQHTNFIARLHIRIMAVTIILLWLRLMKTFRTFSLLGPFIVMLGHMLGDLVKFVFLYLEFYIPYACAFWMIFGENKVPEEYQGLPGSSNYTVTVSGFNTADALLFSLFRITLVDDYDYDGMKSVDYIMADILVGTWLAISAVLMLNLFIALLSDTFQRVYDNAKANAVMQKAIFILNLEEGMSKKRRFKFRNFIHKHCNPEEDFYDDDATEATSDDLKKVTFQIKDQLEELREELKSGRYTHNADNDSADENADESATDGPNVRRYQKGSSGLVKSHLKKLVTSRKLEEEIDVLRDDMQAIRDTQDHFMGKLKKEVVTIRTLLQHIVQQSQNGQIAGGIPQSASMTSLPSFPPLSRRTSVISAGRAADIYGSVGGGDTPSPQIGGAGGPLLRSGSIPPSRGTVLATTMEEDEWEESERRRKQELEELRRELAEQAQASAGHYTEADQRQSITPHNTIEPDDSAATQDFGENVQNEQ